MSPQVQSWAEPLPLSATYRSSARARCPRPLDRAAQPPIAAMVLPHVSGAPVNCYREKCANNPIKADHSRLKSRLRQMRGLTQLHCARVISAGHALVPNIRRGHDELGVEDNTPTSLFCVFYRQGGS